MFDNREWLDNLKPGDKVWVQSGRISPDDGSVHTVTRRTKTQIVTVCVSLRGLEHKWRVRDGYKVGTDRGSWGFHFRIEPLTQNKIEARQRLRHARRLAKVDWTKLDLATLKRVWDVVEAAQPGAGLVEQR